MDILKYFKAKQREKDKGANSAEEDRDRGSTERIRENGDDAVQTNKVEPSQVTMPRSEYNRVKIS